MRPSSVIATSRPLVWKNLLMHPVWRLFAWIMQSVGLSPIDWFAEAAAARIILIVACNGCPTPRFIAC